MIDIKTLTNTIKKNKDVSTTAMPIWHLNDQLTKEKIIDQLDLMKEQNILKIAVKLDEGLVPAYDTTDFDIWFDFILNEAKSRNQKIVFCDDSQYSHPGMHSKLTEQNKAYRMNFLCLNEVIKAKGGKTIEEKISGDINPEYLFAFKSESHNIEFSSLRNITSHCSNGNIKWKAPVGEWKIFVFSSFYNKRPIGGYHFNCLDNSAVKAYIESSFGTIKTKHTKHFGTTIKGFLVESPGIAPETALRGIPWSAEIEKKLKSLTKVDVDSAICSLFLDNFGSSNSKVRRAYYKLLITLYSNNFVKEITEYANTNKISVDIFLNGGDLYTKETLLKFDYSSILDKNTIAGISSADSHSLDSFVNAQFLSDMSKLKNNNANKVIIGRNKNGIGQSLKEIKYECDRYSICGLHNTIVDGTYYSIKYRSGMRVPSNVSPNNAGFESYSSFLNYSTYKEQLLSNFTNNEEVAVLFPGETFYNVYNPSNLSQYKTKLSNFNTLVKKLNSENINFSFINENILESLTLNKEGHAILKDSSQSTIAAYKVILLPESIYIPKKFLSLIEKFITNGGKIIFYGNFPYKLLDESESVKVFEKVEGLISKNISSVFYFQTPAELSKIKNIVTQAIDNKVSIYSDNEDNKVVLSKRFANEKETIVMFLNTSHQENTRVEVTLGDNGFVYNQDLNAQQSFKTLISESNKEIHPFTYNFLPNEPLLLGVSPKSVNLDLNQDLPIEEANRLFRVILRNEWTVSPKSLNALPLSSWNMKINSNREINTGFNISYETYFNVDKVPETAKLLLNNLINRHINGSDSAFYPIKISFNGNLLKDMQFFKRGENSFEGNELIEMTEYGEIKDYAANISGMIKKGINRISIKTLGSSFSPMLVQYPVILLGDFSIQKGERGVILTGQEESIKYGSWTEQGYPYFSGTLTYRQMFEKPGNYKRVILRFKNFDSFLKLRINGTEVPMTQWAPAQADITDLIQDEKNNIEIDICNTSNNLLKIMDRPAGLTSEIYMDIY